jgi:hypothetical protein
MSSQTKMAPSKPAAPVVRVEYSLVTASGTPIATASGTPFTVRY